MDTNRTSSYGKQEESSTRVTSSQSLNNAQSKSVAWLGVIGSLLLVLGATIFAWSSWNKVNNGIKVGLIAVICIFCYGASQYLAKKLPVMEKCFYALISLFSSCSIASHKC